MRQIKVLAVLFALLPGIAAAQVNVGNMPINTVIGRLGIKSGPAQAIPFATLFGNAGIAAGPQSCASHNWFSSLGTGGALVCTQPSFADLTSTIAAAQLIPPTASTLGGVQSKDCTSGSQFVQKINTDGTITCATPAGAGTVTSVATSGLASGGPITGSGTVTVTAAAKSDQQAGSSAVLATTPSQQGQHDSAAKVHGLFTLSGTTLVLSPNSLNINPVGSGSPPSSRTSAGQYIVGFTTPFANATYDCHTSASAPTSSGADLAGPGQVSQTAAQISITVTAATAFSVADPAAFSIECFGRQ